MAKEWAHDPSMTNQSPSLGLSYSLQEKAALTPQLAEQGLLRALFWSPGGGTVAGRETKANGQREEKTESSLASTHIASFSAGTLGIGLSNFP